MAGSSTSAVALRVLAPGVRLGRYVLLRRLACGGMAELHLAKQDGIEGFEKLVVIKRVLPHLAEDPDFLQMFINEARLAATLDHPNIAQVHDIGLEAGEHFFAMEYVHGRNLLEVLKESGEAMMPLDAALTVVTGVAAGLHHAHEHVGLDGRAMGVVHRDVSPANVMLSYGGAIKLTDFGIAKAVERTSTTLMGRLKGKVGYMSPEQCRCEALDRRSDIFGLGILLYEITTGVRAFYAPNDFAIMAQIARGDVTAPSVHVPDYPEELEAIVMRALASKPADRFETAEEFQMQVEAFAQRQGLTLSSIAVARHMKSTFGAVPPPSTDIILDPAHSGSGEPIVATTGTKSSRRRPSPVVVGAVLLLTGGALGALVMTTAMPSSSGAERPAAPQPTRVDPNDEPSPPASVVAIPPPALPPPAVEEAVPAEQAATDDPPAASIPDRHSPRPSQRARKKAKRKRNKAREHPESAAPQPSDRDALYPPGHAP